MKASLLALIISTGLTLPAPAASIGAPDWAAAKTRALAYYEAYAVRFADNAEAHRKITDVRTMAKNMESRETLRNGRTKALLALRESDPQERAKRAVASDALANLRLYYLYGNLLPRILNEFDDGLVEQGVSRPFPMRPLAITEDQFKAEQARLIGQIGLSRDEIDPGPEQ
jgi:hypothetical protein